MQILNNFRKFNLTSWLTFYGRWRVKSAEKRQYETLNINSLESIPLDSLDSLTAEKFSEIRPFMHYVFWSQQFQKYLKAMKLNFVSTFSKFNINS